MQVYSVAIIQVNDAAHIHVNCNAATHVSAAQRCSQEARISVAPEELDNVSTIFLVFLTLEVAMSDGPHRSLRMPRGWKKLAKRADNKAYAPEEVRDALPEALEHDWRAEVPDSVCKRVRDILGDKQSSLFGDQRADRLEALRGEAAGYALGNALLDYAIEAAARGRCGDEALRGRGRQGIDGSRRARRPPGRRTLLPRVHAPPCRPCPRTNRNRGNAVGYRRHCRAARRHRQERTLAAGQADEPR